MKKILMLVLSIACLAAVVPAQKPTVKVEPDLLGDTKTATISLRVPEYPAEALGKGFDGVVSVAITVDKDGSVAEAKAARGPAGTCEAVTDPAILAFRRAATEAALQTTFQTPLLNGQPAQLHGVIRYDFERSDEKEDAGSATGPKMIMMQSSVAPADQAAAAKAPPDTMGGAILNGTALSLPKPPYPPAAHAVRATGAVGVRVLIDTEGNIFSAISVSGHPLLRPAAETAACGAKFTPTLLYGEPVKVSGIITYNFVP